MKPKQEVKRVARRAAISVNVVAQGLDVSPWAVYEAINRGEIPHVKVGRAVRIPLSEARRLWPGVFDGDLTELLIEPEPTTDEPQPAA